MTYEKRPLSSPDRESRHHNHHHNQGHKRQHLAGITDTHVVLDNLLDLDTDIDFETAYQLFSNFDNVHEKGFGLFDQHIPNDHTQHTQNGDAQNFNQEIRHGNTQLPASQSMLPETPNTAFLNEVANPLQGLSPLLNNTGKTPSLYPTTDLPALNSTSNSRQPPHIPNLNPLVPSQHIMDHMALQHLPNGTNILSPSPIMSPQFLNQPLHHTVQINQNMHELRNTAANKQLQHSHMPQMPFSPRIAEELLQHTGATHMPNSPNTQRNNDKLLSAFESTAIENFLDSLIDNQNAPFAEPEEGPMQVRSPRLNPAPVVPKTGPTDYMESAQDSTITTAIPFPETTQGTAIESSRGSIDTKQATESPAVIKLEDSEPGSITPTPFNIPKPRDYVPPSLELPDIIIPDSKIPPNIMGNEVKIKKWRHVQVEKVRRTHTKNSFEELTSMLSKEVGDKSKRVPKYLLLNAVVDDIKAILTANVELEKMINEK